ncbi:hypothetical protein KIN20_035185 [Parelaphostrongylus tenuis]|uniref:Uncharacterized protein n=1 Tax=Parelaphostrongylus tenuis TaxID=148309 RepID=A0AAD5WJR2_PARTN|nr:hypothetical protein KIN20_035185 [Parelaphostrongylus tenuis]
MEPHNDTVPQAKSRHEPVIPVDQQLEEGDSRKKNEEEATPPHKCIRYLTDTCGNGNPEEIAETAR